MPAPVEVDHTVDGVEAGAVGVDAEAHLLQGLQNLPLAVSRAGRVQRVHERLQVAAGRHPGIELTNAAGARVAGIHERLAAGRLHLPVQLLELGDREVDLAADFERLREPFPRPQGERHAADGPDVGGDVLAHQAVASSGGADQPAPGVGQAHR
jgi:hypothetical protein